MENSKCFTVPKKVYLADTDATGIGYYARHLEWLEMARIEFITRIYKPLSRMIAEDRISFMPIRVEIDYKAPPLFEDELTIYLTIKNLDKLKMVLSYQVTKMVNEKVIPVSEAEITMLCVDLEKGSKPCRIPEALTNIFQEWLSGNHNM
ncbi:MAG TPA: thioesterase family protein [Bacillota bacterium]|nr:thioesterase family protein [Bacillota bacterium]